LKVSFEILELIKRYVKGEGSDEERRTLEQLLVEQPELQEEIDLAKMLVKETEELERQRILDMIESTDSPSEEEVEIAPPSSTSIFSNKKIWWILIGFLIALIALLGWWKMKSAPLEKKVYAFQQNTYIIPSNENFLRGSTSMTTLDEAYREYVLKDYKKSLSLLQLFSDQDSLYLQSLYLKGHNFYLTQNYRKSIEVFDEILSKKELGNYYAPDWDNIGWTRILAKLSEEENFENNKTALKKEVSDFLKVANPTDVYFQNAKQLEGLLD